MKDKQTLAKNIEALWRSSGLTQAEFGARYGSNQKSLWAYIHGHNEKPSADFLFRLCEDYQIDIEFLKSTPVKIKDNRVTNYTRSKKNIDQAMASLNRLMEMKAEFDAEFKREMVVLEKLIKSMPRSSGRSK